MKLFYCMECQDLVKLVTTHTRSCECGQIKGIYIDNLNAKFCSKSNNYFLVGFANQTVTDAVNSYFKVGSPDGWGINFSAFVIPEPCETFVRVSEEEFEKVSKNDLH